jgi:hypothetical protein
MLSELIGAGFRSHPGASALKRNGPGSGEAGAKVREEHADIGIMLMWGRSQPTPIKFGFREWPVLIDPVSLGTPDDEK